MFRIYTKTGDKGATSLIGGERVPKSHIRIDAYGTVDELNSFLGLVGDLCGQAEVLQEVRLIQDRLFTIGSALATSQEKEIKMRLPHVTDADVTWLEQRMDAMDAQLPELRAFILPGGHSGASACHVARCVCRRVERICVAMQEQEMDIAPLIIQYLNRLSDYLFVLARYIGHIHQAEEVQWNPAV